MARDFSEKEKSFFSVYGSAMEQWQFVELYCYYIFIRVIGCYEDSTGSIIYNEIRSFEFKLVVITKILNNLFGRESELFKRWKAARGNINKAREFRNDLAHHTFIRDFNAEKMKEGEISLIPPFSEGVLYDKLQQQIEETDLIDIEREFKNSHLELRNLHDDLRNALSSVRKSE